MLQQNIHSCIITKKDCQFVQTEQIQYVMRNFEDNLMIFHYHKKNLDQFGLMLTVFNSFSWYPTIELWILQPNLHYCIIIIQNKKRTLIFSAFCDTQQNGCRFRDNPQFNCGFYDQIYIIVSLLQNKKWILYIT